MARALTSPELALLRSSIQFSKLYLAVHKPNTIYTALLNGVPASNDQVYEITFDNGTGTLGDVTTNMTLYVGTSAGAFDLGMCRIRKAPIAGTFYIGLTSEIRWNAGGTIHLTVVDDFDLWAKHATITDEALSMDVDVAFSDQHIDFNPVPIMGPHAVVWLDTPVIDVLFDASDSWVFDSTISVYAWTAPGSSASSGMTSATPTITYNATGIYRVYCTVTAANGKTTTGVRHVFVYDRDENQPSTVFQLAQCYADYESGGWMFDMEMQAEASLTDIRDRSLVVLFAEDWYGETKQSIGPVENRENIVCVGRVIGESIRWDRESGRVHFTVQGAHHWLSRIKAFPIELSFASNTPDSWSVIPEMTVDRALWHILYWHSTVIETMDFYPTEDTRYLPEGKTLASTIWGQLQDIAVSRILASGGVDRFGRLFVSIDPQMTPEADRTFATVMTLTDDDWQEGIDLRRVVVNDVSLITLTSQIVDESGAVSVVYSLSPGHVPKRYGEPEQADRLLAASQTESNETAGLLLGWRTNEYPEVPVTLAQNNRMIDIFPPQFCALAVTADDTPRGVAYDGNLIPRRVSLFRDGDSGFMHPELNFEAETFEQPNIDGDVPDVDDLSIPPFGGFDFPTLPDLDPIFPGDTSSTPEGPPVVVIVDDTKGFLFTENFNSDSPTWKFWNNGIATADKPYFFDAAAGGAGYSSIFRTPSGAYYAMVQESTFRRWFVAVYYAPSLGSRWTKIIDQTWLDANEGSGAGILGMGFNPNKAEEVALIIGDDIGGSGTTKHFWLGNATSFAQKTSFAVGTNFSGGLTFGGNRWIYDLHFASSEYWVRFLADGSSIEYQSTNFGQGRTHFHVRAGTSPLIFKSKPGVTGLDGLLRSDDNGDTWDVIDVAATDGNNSTEGNLKVSYDGNVLFGEWDSSARRGVSTDSGYSWSGSFFTFGSYFCYAFAGGNHWILGRGYVRFSPDNGANWEAREGNLAYLIPTGMNIGKIIVPGVY